MTSAQVTALATWSAVTDDKAPLSVEELDSASSMEPVANDITVRRGDTYARISESGELVDVAPRPFRVYPDAHPADLGERSAAMEKGASVQVKVDINLAIELAAFGAGDEAHALGWDLLAALGRSDRPLVFPATVAFGPPPDRAGDPGAPVSLVVPDLDSEGNLFTFALRNVEVALS